HHLITDRHGTPLVVSLTSGNRHDVTQLMPLLEQGSMIRRYIIWRNRHAQDERLREVVDRVNVA
ncbi:hypothetical protein ABZ788_40090, partial [Streptomyces tendae]